ncbi:MAG: hypothetical protein M3134_01200 [Actinomycetota bacterium]|nr:hypothetical protein [Actinomycetota bacterium]
MSENNASSVSPPLRLDPRLKTYLDEGRSEEQIRAIVDAATGPLYESIDDEEAAPEEAT